MAIDEKTVIKESADLDAILAQLPVEMRFRAMKSAMTKAGRVVIRKAKQKVPRGDPADKPHLKPLWKTIGQVVKSYKSGAVWVAIVGPKRPGGAHGHLIEGGHKVYARGPKGRSARGQKKPIRSGTSYVPGKEFMAPAVDSTLSAQDQAIRDSLAQSIIKAGG